MTESQKPKGPFWIQISKDGDIMSATQVSAFDEEVNPSIADEIHVIEYTAYVALEKKLKRLNRKVMNVRKVISQLPVLCDCSEQVEYALEAGRLLK